MSIEPGIYTATIVDCGMKKSKSGNEMVFVTFETKPDAKRINWFGSLKTDINKSGKSAAMFSIEQLLKIGFTNNWDAFANAADLTSVFADPTKAWEIVVETEHYDGKDFTKVKYINDPEAPRGADKLERAEAVTIVQSKNLKALTLQAQASMPKPQFKTTSQAKPVEDIPF